MGEIFKTEFKGYNKKEVTDYIAALNEQLVQLKDELDSRETELARVKARLDDAADTEQLEKELREKLRADIEAEIRGQIDKERQEDEIAAENDGEYVPREELSELRERAARYDEQKNMLAELMITARTDAAEVMRRAQQSSEDAADKTRDMLRLTASDFNEMKRNVLASKSEMDARLENIGRCLDDFAKNLDIVQKDIENTIDNFDGGNR